MEKIEWARLTRAFFDRINRLLRYGTLNLLNSATGLQQAQIGTLDGQQLQGLEVFEPYGFTSAPHPGAEALVAQVGAQRGNEVILALADRRYRLTSLVPGEVALYDDLGNVVHLARTGIVIQAVAQVQVVAPQAQVTASESVTINTATATVTATSAANVTAPAIGLTGATTVTGTLAVSGALTAAGGLAVTGGAGATVQGGLAVTGGDITADGKSLKTHVHGGVTTGSGDTGVPL